MLVDFAGLLVNDMGLGYKIGRILFERSESSLALVRVKIAFGILAQILGNSINIDAGLFSISQERADVVLSIVKSARVLVEGLATLRGNEPAVAEHAIVHPVGEITADGGDGDIVNKGDDHGEDRQRKNTVRENAIDLLRGGKTLDRALLNAGDEVHDELIALVGDDRVGTIVELRLSSDDGVAAVHLTADFLLGKLIALEQLNSVIALHLVGDGSGELLLDLLQVNLDFLTEMRRNRRLAGAGLFDHSSGNIFKAIAMKGRDLDNRNVQPAAELLRFDGITALLNDVHLIEGNDHGKAELHQLGGEVQVAFEIRCVHDIQDRTCVAACEVIACDDFFVRVRRKRIDTGKVDEFDFLVAFEGTRLALDRYARPVADILMVAGELVEQRRLARVRITHQSNFH